MALRSVHTPGVTDIERVGASGNINYNAPYTIMAAVRLNTLASTVGAAIYPIAINDTISGGRDSIYLSQFDDGIQAWTNNGSGTDSDNSIGFTPVVGRTYWMVLRRTSSTNLDILIFEPTIGTAPTPVYSQTQSVGTSRGTSGFGVYTAVRDLDIDCVRGWNSALTNAEIFAERLSRTAVKASPVFDISLMTPTNVTDTAGSNDFSVSGGTVSQVGDLVVPLNATVLARDDFNRDDGALGANWTTGPGSAALAIVDGEVQVASASSYGLAYFNGSFPNDQWAQVTAVKDDTGDYGGNVCIRVNTSTGAGYSAWWGYEAGLAIDEIPSVGFIASDATRNTKAGDQIRIEGRGTTITVKVNGTKKFSTTDSSNTAGQPAMGVFVDSGTDETVVSVDNFSAGGFSGPYVIDAITPKQSNALGGTTETFSITNVQSGKTLIMAHALYSAGSAGALSQTSITDSNGTGFTKNKQAAVGNIMGAISSYFSAASGTHNTTSTFSGKSGAIYANTFGVEVDGIAQFDTAGSATFASGGISFAVTTDAAITESDGIDFLLIATEADPDPVFPTPDGWDRCGTPITDSNGMTSALYSRTYSGAPLEKRSAVFNMADPGAGVVVILASYRNTASALSARWDTDTDKLDTQSNLPNGNLFSAVGRVKIINLNAGSNRPVFWLSNSAVTEYCILRIDTTDNLAINSTAGGTVNVVASPAAGVWWDYFITVNGTGAGNMKVGYKLQSDANWTILTTTAPGTFTPSDLIIGSPNSSNYMDMECGGVKIWSGAVLTPDELLLELTSRDAIRTANINRVLKMLDGATAGTDTSGNSYDMTNVGIVSGASAPTMLSIADQKAFRFYNDDGNEAGATAAAAQNTNAYSALTVNGIVRFLIQGTNDLASFTPTLEYKKNGGGSWTTMPAGADANSPTITFGAIGTGATGTNTAAPSYPSGISATTSELFALVTGRHNTASTAFSAPAGWTLVSSSELEGGTGTFAADTGTRRVAWFKKNTVTGSESGTETFGWAGGVSNANNTIYASIIRVVKPANHTISVAAGTGADTTNGTGYSATSGTALSFLANDLLLVGVAQNIDTGTQSAEAISATSVTFGTLTNQRSVATTQGFDHRHIMVSRPVSSVTGTPTSAPLYSYTCSASCSGPASFLRLRSVQPVYEIRLSPSSNIAASAATATTNRLTGGSGAFTAGKISDDTNPVGAIDIGDGGFTEVAFCFQINSPAVNTDYFDLRIKEAQFFTQTARVTAGSGTLSAATGMGSETDTPFALTKAKDKNLSLSSETDTAFTMTMSKAAALGMSTETDTSFNLTKAKDKNLSLSTETETCLSLTGVHFYSFGMVTETDSAFALTKSKAGNVPIFTETDTSFALVKSKDRTIGMSVEADSVPAQAGYKYRSAGMSSETDTSFNLQTTGTNSAPTGMSVETDTAIGGFIVTKNKNNQNSIETNTALALTRSKDKSIGLAQETQNLSFTPGTLLKYRSVGLSEETGLVLALVATKIKSLTQTLESDSSLDLPAIRTLPVGLSEELDEAFRPRAVMKADLIPVEETDVAFSTQYMIDNYGNVSLKPYKTVTIYGTGFDRLYTVDL